MELNEIRNGDVIILSIEGRADANTSPKLQSAILAAYQKGNHLIIDFEKVEYVSSAGLRALLIGQKTANSKGGTMIIKNVPEQVMTVLELSGFTGILTIENSGT